MFCRSIVLYCNIAVSAILVQARHDVIQDSMAVQSWQRDGHYSGRSTQYRSVNRTNLPAATCNVAAAPEQCSMML